MCRGWIVAGPCVQRCWHAAKVPSFAHAQIALAELSLTVTWHEVSELLTRCDFLAPVHAQRERVDAADALVPFKAFLSMLVVQAYPAEKLFTEAAFQALWTAIAAKVDALGAEAHILALVRHLL